MKFLIDAQLPPMLCEILISKGVDALHVNSLPKGDESTDNDINRFANENEFVVITKDSDFYHSHMIFGEPRKLLLITTGNIKNKILFDLIRANSKVIMRLFETCSYVELNNNGIISHD